MENIDNIQQYKIYADAIEVSRGEWEFLHKRDKAYYASPENDFHIPVFLTLKNNIFEYVQIDVEKEVEKAERQEVNPFFMELSFFDGIKQNKVLSGGGLTSSMAYLIRESRPELSDLSISEVKEWFNQVGINELPWNPGTPSEVTIDDIDRLEVTRERVVSKANYFNIDIHK